VGFVDQQQRTVSVTELAQSVVPAVDREREPTVGEVRLGHQDRHILPLQDRLHLLQVVELRNARVGTGIQPRAEVRPAMNHAAVGIRSPAERLVSGAVVGQVEHQDLGTAGDRAGDVDCVAAGVTGRQRDVPVRQTVVLGQHLAHHHGVLGGRHGGHAVLE
jgi:hypothetical protein